MENDQLIKQLNSKMKKYLIYAFSISDYFKENKNTITIGNTNKKFESDEEILTYSFFLAGLKFKEITKLFGKHNINFNTSFDYFKNKNKIFEIKSTSKTNTNDDIKLEQLFNNLETYMKKNLDIEEKIELKDLEPFLLFDYIFYSNLNKLLNLLKDTFYITQETYTEEYEENITSSLDSYLEKLFTIDYGNIKFKFVNNKTFTIFKSGTRTVNLSNYSNYSNVMVNSFCELLEINGEHPNKENIHLMFNDTDVDYNLFTLKYNDNGTDITVRASLSTSLLLNNENENNNKIDSNTNTYTPSLDKYGKDLTAYTYLKDPAVGREAEIKRIEQVLLYPEKDKSIIITGEAGCGKTALVRGLAYRIQHGDVPIPLKKIRIISIDTSTLVAGTKYVGTLEEKMKDILEEASSDKNIIIFIDEIHQALSGGKAENNNNSVSEILKPYIDYGDVRIIGSTTTEEYEKYVENDQAFKTRLKKIAIGEPDDYVTYQILDDLINKYDEISYSKLLLNEEEQDMIIKWLIESTSKKFRTYNDRASNPRLVIDILKEAYAIAAINDHEKVTMDDLAEAFRCEDRLYKSSMEVQIEKLKYFKPSKQLNKIIQFVPKK